MARAQPQRRKQADRRQEAVQKILDTAETIFAANGFNGTTLNEVAKSTGIDTALLRYYFTDKDGLFNAVLKRRMHHINAIQVAALDGYAAEMGDALTLEGLIDVFVRPGFELMAADEGWRNFAAILAYLISSRSADQQMMSANFDATAHKFIALMQRALPQADRREVYWAYHFFTGAFIYSLGQTELIDVLSGGEASTLDFAAINDRLVITMAAGMRALCMRDMTVPLATEVQRRVRPSSP